MSKTAFEKIDLNLIKVFFIVYKELNTYSAAEQLKMSQPNVSRSIQKLREAFDDALFVKTRHGLLATEKADYLALALTDVWRDLEQTINHSPEFNLEGLKGTIRAAIHPSILDTVSHYLFLSLREHAPQVELIINQWDQNTAQNLADDKIDFAISIYPTELAKSVSQRKLASLTSKVYVSKKHPLVDSIITEQHFAQYPVAIVHIPGWNEHISNIERIMKEYAIHPKIVFRSPHPSSVISVVAQTEIIHPSPVKYQGVDNSQVVIKDAYMKGEKIEFDSFFCHHYRHRNKPLYQWLFQTINSIFINDHTI